MNIINSLLRSLKYPPLPSDPFEDSPRNEIKEAVASWTCVPKEVRGRVYEETYQRCVGPSAMRLEKSYKVWSNEVYGELLPPLLSEIFSVTGLGPDSLFMDLGSGVGNAVLQASMLTGCRSYGIEIGKMPAELARAQLEQMKKRCRMWSFSMGEVELEEGDMLKSERVPEMMKKADVVLINNKVFAQTRGY
jgi:[histone H3]-lysine79 N-trimethyltransferase